MASLITFLSVFLNFLLLRGEQILDTRNEDFDFDGLPGVSYEFKVEIKSGQEECFYQKIAKGAKLHVSYEVLRGTDRLVDFYLLDWNRKILDSKHSMSEGSLDKEIEFEGLYTVCIDNFASRSMYGSKLVYLYIITYVLEDWDKYLKEIEGVSSAVTNFTTSISSVQTSIEAVRLYQAQSRMVVIKDWYLVIGNNTYIMWWSVFQIFIIMCASASQVFLLRRMFTVPVVTSSSKPRA